MEDEGLPTIRVALIDDDDALARAVTRLLDLGGAKVTHLRGRAQIEAMLAQAGAIDPWDVILLDVNLPDFDGLEIMHRLRSRGSPTAVIMVSGDGRPTTATAALRAGAYHYVVKPFVSEDFAQIVHIAARQTERARQLRPVVAPAGFELERAMVGDAPAIVALRARARQLAGSPVSVLVSGEPGTGKAVVARALHELSERRRHRFVAIHCSGIPERLIDRELFGRGGRDGRDAAAAKPDLDAAPGALVEADGGTLFLDEIGDLPLAVQARLVRAIQHGEGRPPDGDRLAAVSVRVIAATTIDLARAVAAGLFRADLFFRLNVVNLAVPPLRERRADLPLLVEALLRKHGATPSLLGERARATLHAYAWPGNVRELESTLLHALAYAGDGPIEPSSLPPHVGGASGGFAAGSGIHARGDQPGLSLSEAKRRAALDFERIYLVRLMERSNGSVAAAARLAGIDRTNFRRLLQRHGIDSAQFR